LSADKAREAADDIARRVLANPVIESYRVEIEG
jgi:phosphoribosylformylglycinamidine (FGAM) synthase PurS component